jgi:2-desacetyl-2-hydroxyethyl bacteriochlorophyllide A dehydrogenase
MKRHSLVFTAPRQITVIEEDLPQLQPGQVMVRSLTSAISPGTEMLIYRGQFPQDQETDLTIQALSGKLEYPMKYGYSMIGKVIDASDNAHESWVGRYIFAFHPHESLFAASPEELIPLPEGILAEDAVFLPNMETAVNFLMDGAPLIGERVLVFGQGIVGLLTTTLLARFPLACLVTLDRYTTRRDASLRSGAQQSLDPASPDLHRQLQGLFPKGADLTYELSGSPAALDEAIASTGFEGRVVIGSWYGQKRAALDLGGRFHRSRISLISSQVSTVAARFSGRWTKSRRLETAWEMLNVLKPSKFISQRFPFSKAEEAYRLLDQKPEETIQVLMDYDT